MPACSRAYPSLQCSPHWLLPCARSLNVSDVECWHSSQVQLHIASRMHNTAETVGHGSARIQPKDYTLHQLVQQGLQSASHALDSINTSGACAGAEVACCHNKQSHIELLQADTMHGLPVLPAILSSAFFFFSALAAARSSASFAMRSRRSLSRASIAACSSHKNHSCVVHMIMSGRHSDDTSKTNMKSIAPPQTQAASTCGNRASATYMLTSEACRHALEAGPHVLTYTHTVGKAADG